MSPLLIWIYRISLFIAFLVSIYIIHRSNRNKKKAIETEKQIVLPICLNIWSTLTLYTVPISCILFLTFKLPQICSYTYYVSSAALGFPKFFLTCFQISRLHLCFSESQIHSKYGYSSCLFVILYIIGFILIIYTVIYPYFTIKIDELPDQFGCEIELFYDAESDYVFLTFCTNIIYTVWDLTVLYLYIYKLRLATKHINAKESNEKNRDGILKRIQSMLKKMLLLTIIHEICGNMLTHLFLWSNQQFIRSMLFVFWSLDFVITSNIMYLMLEHNKNDYIKLLKVMKKLRLFKVCCCCSDLLDDDKNGQKGNKQITIAVETTQFDTRTGGIPTKFYEQKTINNSIDTTQMQQQQNEKCGISQIPPLPEMTTLNVTELIAADSVMSNRSSLANDCTPTKISILQQQQNEKCNISQILTLPEMESLNVADSVMSNRLSLNAADSVMSNRSTLALDCTPTKISILHGDHDIYT